jgi:AcrR family transcriptional regulator
VTSPSQTTRSPLQRRVATAIVEAAAEVFAARADGGSLNEVAELAGVGRATLYRYFANREALLAELADVAAAKVADRLGSARIDGVAVEEGLRRAVAAFVDVGDYFVVLAREGVRASPARLEAAIKQPLRRLLDRGGETGTIRSDIPSALLSELLVAQIVVALSARPTLGREDAVATVTSMFLQGARAGDGSSDRSPRSTRDE